MDHPDPWTRWQERMGAAHDAASAEQALYSVAAEAGALLARGHDLRSEWAPLGIHVEQRPLATSGLCVRGTRRGIVRARDPLRRRRYTVAHELAHPLLARTAGRGMRLSSRHEEKLCERFASRMLIPRDTLAHYLEAHPAEPSLEWLTVASDAFRVSLSAFVIALAEEPRRGEVAFVVARRDGHPRRPHQVDLRIAHAAAPPWLHLPVHQRLQSLGWGEFAGWEREQQPGARRLARDFRIALGPGRAAPRRTLRYAGPVRSEAIVVAGRYRAVVALDVSELAREQRMPRRKRSAGESPAGQL